MKLTEQEKQNAYTVITGIWEILKKHGKPVDRSEEYWGPVINAGSELVYKVREDEFCVRLIRGYLDSLEAYLKDKERSAP